MLSDQCILDYFLIYGDNKMPKGRKKEKNGNSFRVVNEGRKHLIGTRKTGKSGYTMTSSDLKDVLENCNMQKFHNNARAVLLSRGMLFK